MKKILIMVLSYDNPPYDSLMRSQVDTWDSVDVPGVSTLYYHGGGLNKKIKADVKAYYPYSNNVQFPCTNAYYYMAEKFQRALEYAWHGDWDLIFRTNSSSYVNKYRLVEFAEKLPKEKCYAGWEIVGNAGYNIVSGAGIFMSRDVAEILMEEIDPSFEREEDVYIGELLDKAGIPIIDDKSRVDDVANITPAELRAAYHLRFKTHNRLEDAQAMRFIHQQYISGVKDN